MEKKETFVGNLMTARSHTLTGAKMNLTTMVGNRIAHSFGYTEIINGTINNVQEHQIRKDAKRHLSLPYAKNNIFDFSEMNDFWLR